MIWAFVISHMGRSCLWLQDVQVHEATEAATAADHEPAMGLSSSSAGGTSVSQNQGVSDDVAVLEPAALQEVRIKTYCRSEEPVAAWLISCCVFWDLVTNFLLSSFKDVQHVYEQSSDMHSISSCIHWCNNCA